MNLAQSHCVPCEVKIPPLDVEAIEINLRNLKLDWLVKDNKSIGREFVFKNFGEAMRFVNMVADLAEAQGHHPDLGIFYNKVRVDLSTHFIGGLSLNDFILASKIELLI